MYPFSNQKDRDVCVNYMYLLDTTDNRYPSDGIPRGGRGGNGFRGGRGGSRGGSSSNGMQNGFTRGQGNRGRGETGFTSLLSLQ